jgi:PAS domain S-box-containing protein
VEFQYVGSTDAVRRAFRENAWDLVLCDPALPGCGCHEILDSLRENGSDILVVAIAAEDNETLAAHLIRQGVRAFIVPARLARLVPLVQRDLEDARNRRLRELRALLDSSPDPMLVVGPDGRIRHVSRLLETLFGYSEKELAGQPVELLVPEHLRARHVADRESYSVAPHPRPMGVGLELMARHKDGTEIPVEISLGPVRLAGEALVCCGLRDLSERRRADRLLRAIVEGTAGETGEAFLRAVVKNLAAALDVRYAFVSERLHPGENRARALAFWDGAGLAAPFDYPLEGSPCAAVLAQGELVVRSGARSRFPHYSKFDEIGAESFFGMRLQGASGEPLGVLAIVDVNPLTDEVSARTVLRIFASRAAAELERIRATTLLAESERRFQEIFRKAPEYMTLVRTRDETLLDVNETFERATGYLHDEAVGRTSNELGLWAEQGQRDSAFRVLARDGRVNDIDFVLRRRDGALRDNLLAAVTLDISGERCYLFIASDITARRTAENALRESEARLRLVSEGLPAMICYIDTDHRYRYANRRYREFYAGSDVSIDGKTVEEVLGADSWQAARENLLRALSGETINYVANRRRRTDGSARDLDISMFPHRDDTGRVLGIYSLILDVSGRRRAEAALRLRERALEASSNSITISQPTPEGQKIVYVNPAFERITGYAAAEVIGQNPRVLQSDDLDQSEIEKLRIAIRETQEATALLRSYRKDGTLFWNSLHIAPVRDETGRVTHFINVGTDVSELVRAQQELEALNAQLERRVAERTAELAATVRELESFSYTVSHDLRAPLRAIHAFAHLLGEANRKNLSAEGHRLLGRIEANAMHMAALIDGLLDLARFSRKPLVKTRFQPVQIVRELLQDLQGEIEQRRVEIVIGEMETCLADPLLLRQVYANLVGNALKYSADRKQPRIEIGSRTEGAETVYYVRDNGVGFDPRYASKLFGVFERLHSTKEFPGVGVGLATVRRIIERHGGRVWAASEPDKGATFFFTLLEETRSVD